MASGTPDHLVQAEIHSILSGGDVITDSDIHRWAFDCLGWMKTGLRVDIQGKHNLIDLLQVDYIGPLLKTNMIANKYNV